MTQTRVVQLITALPLNGALTNKRVFRIFPLARKLIVSGRAPTGYLLLGCLFLSIYNELAFSKATQFLRRNKEISGRLVINRAAKS